ncbi:branched-chain amino acid ABC transporter permease [Rhizobium rhizogenes]|uniref:branched-chain amino acid ABC transporter permease n=1 Tax=Rhizobium rhizogenes TaxID=359 RepID=UPI003ED0B76B
MVQFVVDVLMRASDLVLIAVGMSAIYSLMKFPNIAVAQYAASGAFIALVLQKNGMPIGVAAIIAVLCVGVAAVALNELLFNRMLKISSSTAMIGSLAVSMLASAVFLLAIGPNPTRFSLPITRPFRVLGARMTENQLTSLSITTVAILCFALLLFRTDLGRCMRATATNGLLAEATGIDTRRTRNAVVLISGMLAALGGICLTLKGEINIQTGLDLLLPVFSAAILGGLGNPLGAAAGAVVIALAETLITDINFGPAFGRDLLFMPAAYATAGSFVLLVVTLIWRPRGFFVSEVKRV